MAQADGGPGVLGQVLGQVLGPGAWPGCWARVLSLGAELAGRRAWLAPQELAPNRFAVGAECGQWVKAGLWLAHPSRRWRGQGDGPAWGSDAQSPQVRMAQNGLHIVDARESDLGLFEQP